MLAMITKRSLVGTLMLAAIGTGIFLIGCGATGSGREASSLSGTIEVDGSSTVFLITEAVADEFQKQRSDVQVDVLVSGTTVGFERFVTGETDINDASRPINLSAWISQIDPSGDWRSCDYYEYSDY